MIQEDNNLLPLAANEANHGMPIASNSQEDTLRTEAFLQQNYMFRHNVLNEKDEFLTLNPSDGTGARYRWQVLDDRALNSIILETRRAGICKGDPAPVIHLYVRSMASPLFNPVEEWLNSLPEWDGINRLAELYSRIPGITTEQIYWCCIWHRSMVAHWLQLDTLHGNETVPILIGHQGAGKSTFGIRLIPNHLRQYTMDYFNMGNKFDADLALTNNLFVVLEEFDRFGSRQQAHLKQALSRVKVNSRRAFGRVQDDRPRFASFMANTNCEHPLTDSTGSRRFICIRIPDGAYIDNDSPIDHEQLYAQALHEIRHGARYWFSNDECREIEKANAPFSNSLSLVEMLQTFCSKPAPGTPSERMLVGDIAAALHRKHPEFKADQNGKTRIGKALRSMGFQPHDTNRGTAYDLTRIPA